MIEIGKTFVLSLTLILFVIAMITDLLYYRIPNRIVVVLFLLFPVFWVLQDNIQLLSHYLLFLSCLAFGFILFKLGICGGGDAKLLAVGALWVGWENFLFFLLMVSLIGGGLAFLYLYSLPVMNYITASLRRVADRHTLSKQFVRFFIPDNHKLENKILSMQEKRLLPYGVAIASAAIFIIGKVGIES